MSLSGFGTYGGLGGGTGGFSRVTHVNVALPSGNAAKPGSHREPVRDERVIEDEQKKA
jgi:hypothetical protein